MFRPKRNSKSRKSRKSRRPLQRRNLAAGFQPLEKRILLANDVLLAESFENGQWGGAWVEDSQNDWFTSSQRASDGAASAEIDGWASNATLNAITAVVKRKPVFFVKLL